MTRACESVSGPQSAHMDNHSVVRQEKGSRRTCAQSAKCATARIRHLCQVKTLTTSARLKHSDFHKIDNSCSHETLLHERTHSTSGLTNSCSAADAK